MNSNISEITIRIDAETLKTATGMTMDELEAIEANLDFALTDAVRTAFPDARKAQGVAFFVSEPTIEAYDADGELVNVADSVIESIVADAVANL